MESRIDPVLIDVKTVESSEDKEVINLRQVFALYEGIAKYSCVIDGNPFFNGGIACHTMIRICDGGRVKNLVTNITGDTQGADNILKYLLWKDGPFRKLTEIKTEKPWVVYHDDGSLRALGIPDEVMAYGCFPLVYAFLIVSRIPSEFKNQTIAFDRLLKGGMEPNAAFLLSRRLQPSGEIDLGLSGMTWNGQHTHINEMTNGLDWGMYTRGNHHFIERSSYTGGLWAKKGYSSNSFDLKIFCETVKGRWSEISTIPQKNLPVLNESYEKWLNERFSK